MPNSQPDLSIIIVSWNVWNLLRACIRSIEQNSRPAPGDTAQLRYFEANGKQQTLELIVVDNASNDATPDLVAALFPWVRVIANASNLGFTAGNNRGYALSRGRFVFFLNPDTELLDGSLAQLFTAIAREERVGLVGPQLRYADNSVQSSRRRFPTRLTGFFESTWLGQWWPNNLWSRRLHMAGWPADFQQDVDWVVGAAMLARRSVLEAVRVPIYEGPFDQGFFMYSEELDLCRRIKQAGWRVVYVPQAVIVHYEGRSSEQVVAARHIHFNTSKVRYYAKYFGQNWAEVLRRYLLLEFYLQWQTENLKRLLGHKRALRFSRMKVYRQVIDSGLNSPTNLNQSE